MRTVIPTFACAVVATPLAVGLLLHAETQSTAIISLVGIIQAAYYAAARSIVGVRPAARCLLGTAVGPVCAARHRT